MTVERLGVVGAGIMGAGIAQLGCAAGIATVLHDPLPEALEKGEAGVREGLERWVEKGRAGERAAGLLEVASSIDGLAGCDLAIEAAPERLELKREARMVAAGRLGRESGRGCYDYSREPYRADDPGTIAPDAGLSLPSDVDPASARTVPGSDLVELCGALGLDLDGSAG